MQQVVERVRNDNIEHFVKLGKREWSQCYQGQSEFENWLIQQQQRQKMVERSLREYYQ